MTTFTQIDENKIATPRQIFAVANRFATLTSTDKSERFGKVKVFNAILHSLHGKDCKLTHLDIQKYFECETVPKEILARVKSSPKTEKVSKKPTPVKSSKKTQKVAKKPTLTNRVDNLETKLDSILAILSSKA